VREQHLLNIKDLDLSGHLDALALAGVTSFKIEGRLKDADYVKNVVSQLRRRLDDLLTRRPELGRASLGTVNAAFTPDPTKTFQRGHSTYRIDGERQPMGNPETGRHLGEFIGVVQSVQGDRVVLDTIPDLHPGDGLAFMDGVEAAGTVINAVEPRQLFVQDPSRIRPGMKLHRNLDLHWLRALRSAKVERRIPVRASLDFPEGAVRLILEDPTGFTAEAQATGNFAPPRDEAAAAKAIQEALGRLGNTPFELAGLHTAESRFVPLSVLNALRRDAAAALEATRRAPREREGRRVVGALAPLPTQQLDFTWNVSNQAARAFYERAAGTVLEPAAELQSNLDGRVMMTTRHCLKYEMGWCHVHQNPQPWAQMPEPKGPLFIENGPTRLECRFDCANCRMELLLCAPQDHA
jgi:putative protease